MSDGWTINDGGLIGVPYVLNVTSDNPNGTYTQGDTVSIKVVWSEAVDVDTTGGFPYIELDIQPSGKNAVYASGTSSVDTYFNYSPSSEDIATDLEYLSIESLILSGGTIKAISDAQDAELFLPPPSGVDSLSYNKDIQILFVPASGYAELFGSITPSGGVQPTSKQYDGYSGNFHVTVESKHKDFPAVISDWSVREYDCNTGTFKDITTICTFNRIHDRAYNVAIDGITWSEYISLDITIPSLGIKTQTAPFNISQVIAPSGITEIWTASQRNQALNGISAIPSTQDIDDLLSVNHGTGQWVTASGLQGESSGGYIIEIAPNYALDSDSFTLSTHVEKDGSAIAASGVSAEIFSPSGTLFTMPSMSEDANGVWSSTKTTPNFEDDTTYYAKVSLTCDGQAKDGVQYFKKNKEHKVITINSDGQFEEIVIL